MEKNNGMPKGWRNVNVDLISKVVTGNTPSKKNSKFYGGDIPYFKPADLNSEYYVKTSADKLSKLGLEHARKIPERSILVTCIGATIGKVGFIRISGATNQQINSLIPNSLLIIPELLYFFSIAPQFQESIIENSSSTTMPIINKSRFSQLTIPLPPLNEQRRIVNKIEKLFSELDNAKSTLKKVKLRLVQYRQSLLKSAFENKEWDDIRLGDYLTLEYGKGLPKKDRKNGGIPVYGSSGIGGYHDKALVESSSLIIGRKGNAGNVMLIEKPFWAIDTAYFLKETKEYNLKFLYYLFKNLNLGKLDSSTAIPSLRRDDVYAQNIPLPKIKEQNETVSKIEQGFSLTENTENITNSMLKQINTLHSSILNQAFEGKLVPQDPNDEPASELLKRIKLEV